MYYSINHGNKIIYDFLISKCNGESILFSIDNNILRNKDENISEEDWNNSNIISFFLGLVNSSCTNYNRIQ